MKRIIQMKKISEFSVNYPVTVSMLILAVILLGYISFQRLGIDLFPELNNPRLYVEISAGERPPGEIEDNFVEPIEALAVRQSDVVDVSSVSVVGNAQVTVEYSYGKEMNEAFLDLQKALSSYSSNEDIDEITISQHDPNSDPVLLVALTSETTSNMNDLRLTAENTIRNELIRLEGIADVEISGGEELEVVIDTEPWRLDAYDITLSTISTQISNYNQNISGGSIEEMGQRYVVKGISELSQVTDLENIIVKLYEPSEESTDIDRVPVLLKDVAKVTLRNKDPEEMVALNGKRGIGLSIYKETKFNTVKAVENLQEAFKKLERQLPGYQFTVVQNQGKFISNAIDEVKESAIYGIVLAVIVLFFFLRNFGSTLIVSFAIPISIVATFTLMYFNDLTLNIMTLGGLALGAGMLVDNAIVVMENIFRNHESGLSAKEAATKGTSQVTGAIVASTLTTIVVFLPIVYMHGASGELFKDQAWTVAFSLICSLVVAILVIPMLYTWIFGRKETTKSEVKGVNVASGKYSNILRKVVDKRRVVITASVILLAVAGYLFSFIGSEFMPQTATREFYADVKLPEGTRLARTYTTLQSIETSIHSMLGDNIEHIYCEAGASSSLGDAAFKDENSGTIKVILRPEAVEQSLAIITKLNAIYQDSDDPEVSFRREETALSTILGTESAPVIIEVSGDEMEVLESLSAQTKQMLTNISGLYDVRTSIENGAPEVEIRINRYKAGIYNINISSIVSSISERLEGVDAGEMEHDGEMKDITLKLPNMSYDELENLIIKSGDISVPITEVADIVKGSAPRQINHDNQNRVVKIEAQLEKGIALNKVVNQIESQLTTISLPDGYKFNVTGEEEMRKESMANLTFALILSIVLVYMVMASQFESLVHPFTILLTIPLAVVGSIFTFFILGQPLNIMAYIGIIMLTGIAVNDSIILVDAINQLLRGGMALKEAIATAGERRIRPIIMTSLTTILALFPLTLGFGESAALRAPMALAVIGGLITSTLLTLIVIPCVYYIFESWRLKVILKWRGE